jgi:hypothetical protein
MRRLSEEPGKKALVKGSEEIRKEQGVNVWTVCN